jgi:uncharacterized membrane protein YhaH (DUF805 family)
MDIKFLLTSYQGRIRRLHYWLASIGVGVVSGVVINVLLMLGGFPTHSNPLIMILIGVLYIGVIYIGLALGVKRCHDRDKTGWFLAIGLIPLIGGLWLLVDLGFLDGTPGPNKYGPSPKGIGGEAAPAV